MELDSIFNGFNYEKKAKKKKKIKKVKRKRKRNSVTSEALQISIRGQRLKSG